MAQAYIGSLMLAAFNFAPKGWALCQGQLMAISQNTALFSLLGTYYGGDGRTTFGLPNLQGSIPIGQGQGAGLQPYSLGESGGVVSVTLQTSQVPPHQHSIHAVNENANASNPSGAQLSRVPIYAQQPGGQPAIFNPAALSPLGGTAVPHNNMMPYLVLNWIICLQGIFPPRS